MMILTTTVPFFFLFFKEEGKLDMMTRIFLIRILQNTFLSADTQKLKMGGDLHKVILSGRITHCQKLGKVALFMSSLPMFSIVKKQRLGRGFMLQVLSVWLRN